VYERGKRWSIIVPDEYNLCIGDASTLTEMRTRRKDTINFNNAGWDKTHSLYYTIVYIYIPFIYTIHVYHSYALFYIYSFLYIKHYDFKVHSYWPNAQLEDCIHTISLRLADCQIYHRYIPKALPLRPTSGSLTHQLNIRFYGNDVMRA